MKDIIMNDNKYINKYIQKYLKESYHNCFHIIKFHTFCITV